LINALGVGREGRLDLWGRRSAIDSYLFDDNVVWCSAPDEVMAGWVVDWTGEMLSESEGASAIDVGCGDGRIALILARTTNSPEPSSSRSPTRACLWGIGRADLEVTQTCA
jgi:hypothetical protein